MPEKKTVERARKDKREGKSPSVQAGEFVREEMHRVQEDKRGAKPKSRRQAVAIGLSKARRAGVDLKPPQAGSASDKTRKKARQDLEKGRQGETGETHSTRGRKRVRTRH